MIHILTLTWNGKDKLERLSEGLVKNVAKLGLQARWYIRDNGSTDDTKEWIESFDNPHIEMAPLYIEHNRASFAQGVNSLADLAVDKGLILVKGRSIGSARPLKGESFLLLNNDIEFVDDDSLANMYKLYNHDLYIQMVGARLLYADTKKLQHAGIIFGPRYGNMPYHYKHQEESDKGAEQNRYFQAVTAACCLLTANEFFYAGGMNEKLWWAFEDIDLNLRFGDMGWKIAYCGKTNILHEESASLKKNPVNKMFLQQNVKHFKETWFGKYELDHEKYLSSPNYKLIK